MEIRALPTSAPAPSVPTVQPAQAPVPAAAAVAAPVVKASAPKVVDVRAELTFDKAINRVVGRVIDRETGKTLVEIPPERLRRLYAMTREQLGPLVDKTA